MSEYAKMRVSELKKLLKSKNIRGYSKLRKQELIDKLTSLDNSKTIDQFVDLKEKKPKKKIEKSKKPRKKAEKLKAVLNKNSFYAKYSVKMLDEFLKNYTEHARLYLMNKGYKVQLLDSADIDKNNLPPPNVRGQRQYGIAYGKVKPYSEDEQKSFIKTNYDELHPLKAKKLDKVKQKIQYEMDIKISLNKHQKSFIVNFINSYFQGALLFHSVGSGKTLTAVAFSHYYLSLYPNNNVLILSPPSLLFNFVDGMKEFGLDIRDNRYKFETYVKFSKAPSMYVDEKTLIIIDEVHYFRTMITEGQVEQDGVMITIPKKNKVGYEIIQQCKRANKILAMTGTPMVNGLYDIENIMAMISKRDPLERSEFTELLESSDNTYDYFKYRISHFNIFKTDSKKFFPRVNEIYVALELSPVFKELYMDIYKGENIFKENGNYVTPIKGELYYTPISKNPKKKKKGGELKQKTYDAPVQDVYSKRAFKVLQSINKETGEKELAEGEQLTSFFNAPRQYSNLVEGAKIKFILKKIKENPTFKTIVYSSFITSSIDVLRFKLSEAKIKFLVISGSESAITRNNNKQKFNDINSGFNVLIISKAGTEGISTKNVRQLFMMESQWNEATSEQAIARAVRFKSHFGLPEKDRYVNVYRLQICLKPDDVQTIKNINDGTFKKDVMKELSNIKKINELVSKLEKKLSKKDNALRKDKEEYVKKQRQEALKRYQKESRKNKNIAPFDFDETTTIRYYYTNVTTLKDGYIDKIRKISKEMDQADIKDKFKESSSTDILLTYLSLRKEYEINSFVDMLDEKIPQVEDFKEPLHKQLIEAIDKEKNVEKLLEKQREIIDKIGDKVLQYTDKIQNKLMVSMSNKIAEQATKKEKKTEVSRYNEFFTPPEIVKEMLGYSDRINDLDFIRILEPTAGFGNIVSGVLDVRNNLNNVGTKIDMIEINDKNRKVLNEMQKIDPTVLNLMETKNFMEFVNPIDYDLIVMNPPFHLKKELNLETQKKDLYDIDFVKKAYDMLKPGGELLSITSSYLSHGKRENEKWITENGVNVVKEYRSYKWSPTKEKEEKGKKSTKLDPLNFDIIKITKPEEKKKIIVVKSKKDIIKPIKKKRKVVRKTNKLKGSGLVDNIYDKIFKERPKILNDLIKKEGSQQIKSIEVCRYPIKKIFSNVLDTVTLGQAKKVMARHNYDDLFHLYLIITLNNGKVYSLEKNERVNVIIGRKPGGVCITPKKKYPITLNQFITKAENRNIPNFYHYDAFKDNCQKWVKDLLVSNGMYDQTLNKFIMQDVKGLVPEYIKTIARTITDVAGVFNYLIHGGSIPNNAVIKF